MLKRQVEAGGDDAVKRVLGQRFATYPQSHRSDEEWAAWWQDYLDALGDQPAAALEAGMRQWVKTDTSGFMPKPGQLLALVKAAAEPHWRALSRANRLSKMDSPVEPAQYGTPEERAALAAEVRAAVGIKPIPQTADDEPGMNERK